jgi:hypothetical protein
MRPGYRFERIEYVISEVRFSLFPWLTAAQALNPRILPKIIQSEEVLLHIKSNNWMGVESNVRLPKWRLPDGQLRRFVPLLTAPRMG